MEGDTEPQGSGYAVAYHAEELKFVRHINAILELKNINFSAVHRRGLIFLICRTTLSFVLVFSSELACISFFSLTGIC